MNIQLIDPKNIEPNPYQPMSRRTFKPADLEDLVSIGDPAIGLLQIPIVRPHPEQPGHYQRVNGHRRQAAWELHKPGEPMPNDVQDLSDRQMYEDMAIENAARKDLTPIEKAKLIQNYIDEFGANQLDAGRLVGISSQGGVSNLLSLLALPAGIQILVAGGKLPERFARGLRKFAAVNPAKAIEVADRIVKAPEEKRDDVESESMRTLLRKPKTAIALRDSTPWPLEWPAQPLPVGDKSIGEIPACTGCRFNLERDRSHFCLRPACHAIKGHLYAQKQVDVVAKKLGLTPIGKNESYKVIFNGSTMKSEHLTENQAQLAIKIKHISLRIVPHQSTGQYDYGDYTRDRIFGTRVVDLASVDVSALKKSLNEKAQKGKMNVMAKASFNRAYYVKRDQAAREKRQALIKQNQALVDAALPHLLPIFNLPNSLIDLLWSYQFVERRTWLKTKETEARRRVLLRGILLHHLAGDDWNPAKPAAVQAKLVKLSADMKIKLPHHWDRPAPADVTLSPSPNKRATAAKPSRKGKTRK